MKGAEVSFDWRAQVVLPPDVVLLEIGSLDGNARSELAGEAGEFMIHRPGMRGSAKAINADSARLLESFRKPRRIVDAVVALARSTGSPAEELLNDCFPVLEKMVGAGILAVVGTENAARLEPSLKPGDHLGRWVIEACVRLIEDSEIYRARDGATVAAIKRIRHRGVELGLDRLLAREAKVLRRVQVRAVPGLLDEDTAVPLPWIAIAWREGIRPDNLPTERNLVSVGLAIAECYGELHRQNVLHGDVHPGNLLVDQEDKVSVIDFALARIPGDPALDHIFRGAAQGYWEPEFAAAVLRGQGERPLTPAGEQYAVATLIDRLLTGEEAIRLPAVASQQWHTVAEGERRCFAERGRTPWPPVEAVLRRAMARDPERRFPDIPAFSEALRAATSHRPAIVRPEPDPVQALLGEVSPGGDLFATGVVAPPRASFNFGAAGIAFALYRLARVRESGELLALAELWQARAEAGMQLSDGFYDADEFREENLGRTSPYHGPCGVWLTRALLARASGDIAALDRAIGRYLAAVGNPETPQLDLTLGHSAALLGAAVLYGIRPLSSLRRAGDGWISSIWAKLDAEPPIREGSSIGYLGIAHGWAGFLYAALAWMRATASVPPANLVERLDQLWALVEPIGAQARVPIAVPGHQHERGSTRWMDGWCHGQAGHVFLHLLAARLLGDSHRVDVAARLGQATFEGPDGCGNLCCGQAGRSYAMLALYRATGDRVWLERAKSLAARAGNGLHCDRWPNSLYKGRVGLAVIAAEVERPEFAAMPLFEDEGWL